MFKEANLSLFVDPKQIPLPFALLGGVKLACKDTICKSTSFAVY